MIIKNPETPTLEQAWKFSLESAAWSVNMLEDTCKITTKRILWSCSSQLSTPELNQDY